MTKQLFKYINLPNKYQNILGYQRLALTNIKINLEGCKITKWISQYILSEEKHQIWIKIVYLCNFVYISEYSNICVLTLLGQLQQKIVTNSPNWSGELMSQPYGCSRQGGCGICQGISMGLEPLIMQKGFISPFPSNNWGWDTTFSNKPKVSMK